jgi:hypothetical protein
MNLEFEGKLLLFRVLLPWILGLMSAWLLVQSAASPKGSWSTRENMLSLWVCLLMWIGFWVSDFGSRGILLSRSLWGTWEAREPWMHWVWVGPSVFCVWVVGGWLSHSLAKTKGLRILGYGVGLVLTLVLLAWWMFPVGQGYADLASTFRGLRVLACLAALSNFGWVLHRQSIDGGRWFGWVHVLHLGCVSAVVLQSYASLGEWLIFGGAMGLGAGLYWTLAARSIGPCNPRQGVDSQGALTLLFVISASFGFCVSRAYSWTPMPVWLLVWIAGLPTLISWLDLVVCRFLGRAFWVRLLAVIFSTVGVLGAIYMFTREVQPSW